MLMKKEYKTFECKYMRTAEDPRYLYIHLFIDYGWGSCGGKYMFLYDTSTKELRCSRDNRQMPDFRAGKVKKTYEEIGSIIVEDDVRVQEMFSSQDIPSKWYDVDSYSVFMKMGNRIKYFSIKGPVLSSYPSFHWIIEQAEWINKTHCVKRHGIELRELYHGKFCHCNIPYRATSGEKCICCERKFHDFPLISNNIVSFSLMTYIKLYDITEACFHITINLETKKCKCIKVSEDNIESEIELSRSLVDVLTSQENINELLRGKRIEEVENCLYDGNHFYYIIQQGKKFYRGKVESGYVGFWPIFASITNELYPFFEDKMMY